MKPSIVLRCLPVLALLLGGVSPGRAFTPNAPLHHPLSDDGSSDEDASAPTSGGTATASGAGSGTTAATVSSAYSGGFIEDGGATLTMGGSDSSSSVTVSSVFNSSVFSNGLTVASVKYPVLSGKAGDLKITTNADDSVLRVKATVSVSNTGTKTAKNVVATVYLSDDAVLDAADTQVGVVKLADYAPGGGKLRKGETLSLPVKHKVPKAAAEFLEGKYLIAVLSAKDPSVAATGGAVASSGVASVSEPAGATILTLNNPEAVPPTSVTGMPTGTWTLAPGEVTTGSVLGTVTAGTLVTTTVGTLVTTTVGTIPPMTALPVVTPANYVIIGPIKLP